MSTEKINCTESHFQFFVKIDELTKHWCSQIVVLYGISWYVKLSKRSTNVVDVLLVCSPKATTMDWTCEAKAKITLCSSRPKQRSYTKILAKTEFKNGSESNGISPFITWSGFKEYSYDEQVLVDVMLSANPAFYYNQSEILQFATKSLFHLENVSQLNSKSTATMTVGGTNWYINFRKKDAYLAIYVHEQRDPLNQYWSWDVQCSLKLKSFSNRKEYKKREFDHCFTFNSHGWGYSKFLHWDEFIDPSKNYVSKNKAVFEIELNVSPPKPLWDIDQENSIHLGNSLECPICFCCVIDREPVTTLCGHLFCETCIKQAITDNHECPLCKTKAVQSDLRTIYL